MIRNVAGYFKNGIENVKLSFNKSIEESWQKTAGQAWKGPFRKQQKRWEKRFPNIEKGDFGNLNLNMLTNEQLGQLYRENHIVCFIFLIIVFFCCIKKITLYVLSLKGCINLG